MVENYSQLELAPNEHTEQSPELQHFHDHAANAPELDRTQESPELDRDKKNWPPLVGISNAYLNLICDC